MAVRLIQVHRSRTAAATHTPPPADEEWLLGDVAIERYGEAFIASRPSVGALSTLTAGQLVWFTLFLGVARSADAARPLLQALAEESGEPEGAQAVERFLGRMEAEGWTRDTWPERHERALVSIYFTLTRACDRACPYCYQGLANRNNTFMPWEHAVRALEAIHAVNPDCELIFTGGEPLMHPRVLDVLRLADGMGHSFTLLTNGTYLDDATLDRLQALQRLRYVQVSLDGIREETHAQTRGKGHLAKVMAALDRIRARGMRFVLAPTMHHGNLEEVYAIARLAIAHGGWCKPNILHELPHKGLDFDKVQLEDGRCWQALKEMNIRLDEEFGRARLDAQSEAYRGREACAILEPNTHSICGMGFSLLDLDWNGDVYPCHLTKSPELVLGNLFQGDSFGTIFARAIDRKIRVRSHEIPKCSGCKFVSNCGGGCRANAWFAYGSVAREDSQCGLNYAAQMHRSLAAARAD